MRPRFPRFCGVLLAAGLFHPTLVAADGMRCGTKLVSDGDSTYEVQSRCGEPQGKTKRVELRTVRVWVGAPCVTADARCGRATERTVEVQIEEWTYDFGPTKFIHYATFEDGRLLRVVTGDYGNSR